jgi:hypothetical protein
VVVLERFLQTVPVGAAAGALGPVGHDDVGVTVTVVAMRPMRVLDHLDQPVRMRICAKVMTVNVLVGVAVRHSPDVSARVRSGQMPAG